MIDTGSLWEKAFLSLYLYQDGYLGQGKYSADIRGLVTSLNSNLTFAALHSGNEQRNLPRRAFLY
jgi:hypothetical protein